MTWFGACRQSIEPRRSRSPAPRWASRLWPVHSDLFTAALAPSKYPKTALSPLQIKRTERFYPAGVALTGS